MQARTLVSLVVSLLVTGAMVAALMVGPAPVAKVRASSINGIPVVDLPGITVRPDASQRHVRDRRQHGHSVATRMDDGGDMLEQFTGEAASRAISSHLAMPYYSFGSDIGQISKD